MCGVRRGSLLRLSHSTCTVAFLPPSGALLNERRAPQVLAYRSSITDSSYYQVMEVDALPYGVNVRYGTVRHSAELHRPYRCELYAPALPGQSPYPDAPVPNKTNASPNVPVHLIISCTVCYAKVSEASEAAS